MSGKEEISTKSTPHVRTLKKYLTKRVGFFKKL
jgi:hypothetical protein